MAGDTQKPISGANGQSMEDLLAAVAASGDKAAFAALFSHFAPRVKGFLMKGGASDADAVIGYCSDELTAAAEALVWIQIFSAGAERCVAVEDVANGSILLTNMQKMSSPVIGEHAVAMMLALGRGLPRFKQAMPAGEWRRDLASNPGMQIVAGKTMLVAGLGGIGGQAARRAKALGMEVLATRNSSREGPDYVDYVGLSHELPELVKRADVVVDALPLTGATRDLFDAEMFANFKVVGFHFLLRIFNGLRHHFMFDGHAFFHPQFQHQIGHPLGCKDSQEIILQREEKS